LILTTEATNMTTIESTTYDIILFGLLIILLALKKIMSSEAHDSKRITAFLKAVNVTIMPLLLIFTIIIINLTIYIILLG
jgi:hypothetical protein